MADFIYQKANQEFAIDNVLKIDNPENYLCTVYEYSSERQAILKINVLHRANVNIAPYRVEFYGVAYYEGPMQWAGANFVVASRDEWSQYLQKLDSYNLLGEAEWMRNFTLFTVMTINSTVRILAGRVNLIPIASGKQLFN